MPKPRVFVSSTYYDLKYIRDELREFIADFGFEAVLFEQGNITYDHQKAIDLSCYKDVKASQMLILIIGGRYGSPASDSIPREKEQAFFEWYNSMTREEYLTAIRENIPVYIFIEKQVHHEYKTYLNNRGNALIRYASVDTINVFRFIEEIHGQFANNIICEFERFEDIKSWLTAQWAGLFYEYLAENKRAADVSSLSDKISELGELAGTLRSYLEEILVVSSGKQAGPIITREQERLRRLKHSRVKSKIAESDMIKYLYQHTDLSKDELFEAFCASTSLEDLLARVNVEKKEKDYVLAEPSAVTIYEEYKAMLDEKHDKR